MITVGAFEAKTNLSRLLDQVVAGEQVTITKHGVPVARIVAVDPDTEPAVDVIKRLRMLSRGTSLGGDTIADLKAEGRKY